MMALFHLKATWKIFLSLLYGKQPKVLSRMKTLDSIRTVANTVALATYHQALEAVSPGLEAVLIALPGVWRLVPENARFFLMLGYQIKSVAVYIDAVKHIIGPRTLLPYRDRVYNNPHNEPELAEFQDPVYPREVVQLLLEARTSMNDAALNIQQHMLSQIESSNSIKSIELMDGRTGQLARLMLVNYITTGYELRSRRWPQFSTRGIRYDDDKKRWEGSSRTLPAQWKLLWKCKQDGDMTELFKSLDLYSDAAVFGIDWKDLAEAMLNLLKFLDYDLDDFMNVTKSDDKCRQCKPDRKIEAKPWVYSRRSYRLQKYEHDWASSLCERHQHHAQYSDVNYSTILHTWGITEQLDKEPSYTWPPPSTEYYPQVTRPQLPEIPTTTATDAEIIAMGLKDVFVVLLDEDQHYLHESRYAFGALDIVAVLTSPGNSRNLPPSPLTTSTTMASSWQICSAKRAWVWLTKSSIANLLSRNAGELHAAGRWEPTRSY
ncbi:hypothetical protein OHC33_005879 [Knufia fluminis]|uniref:Uncharacterized protein n=1 Tax=Knufia fluminis TaxID=191047 RepID=A0AAN8ETF7_9EURO|nr:hypothetical protein OHC33_005879 [Knufia fluminis]